jgi:ankyrin repeat protein
MHNDKSEAFAEFIELATDINDTNPSIYDGNTLLFTAAQNNNLDVAAKLIGLGADINKTRFC